MAKVLYIKSSPKGEFSNTNRISDAFINKYKESNPSDEVITLELNELDLKFLSGADLADTFGEKTEASKEHPILKYAYQFLEADKYVFSTPMWNLSFPAVVKAYLDYICVVGITFKYTEHGPVGLCENKKAIHITSRGGDYSNEYTAPLESGDKYLKILLNFLGVKDYTTVAADALDVATNDKEQIIADTIEKANSLVENF